MWEWIVYVSLGWSLLIYLYLLFFRGGSGRRGKLSRILLLVGCLFWPITLLVLALLLTGVIKRRPADEGRNLDALIGLFLAPRSVPTE